MSMISSSTAATICFDASTVCIVIRNESFTIKGKRKIVYMLRKAFAVAHKIATDCYGYPDEDTDDDKMGHEEHNDKRN